MNGEQSVEINSFKHLGENFLNYGSCKAEVCILIATVESEMTSLSSISGSNINRY